jgi:hypothetical protein
MKKLIASNLLLLVLTLLVVACSPAQPASPGGSAPSAGAEGEAPVQAAMEPAGDDAVTLAAPAVGGAQSEQPVTPTEGQEAESEPDEIYFAPGQRTQPAPPDQFASDSVDVIAATGRPQLVEFFTFW